MKPRSDSLYAKLSQLKKPEEVELERLDELMLFLKAGGSYEDGAGLCHEWGVQTSATAVFDCYQLHSFPWVLERARAAATAVGKLPSLEKSIAAVTEQKLFEMVARSDAQDSTVISIRALELQAAHLELDKKKAESSYELKAKDLALKTRRVQMLEAKMDQAKKALEGLKSKGGMTPETQAEIERVAKLL